MLFPSPPNCGSKRELLHIFALPFIIFVAGNRRHFKFGMPIEHRKSQHMHNKLSLKWAWSSFKILPFARDAARRAGSSATAELLVKA